MKLLIISDLHLGDGSKADDFGKNDRKLIKWIDSINADQVILNGDVYELWQFKMKYIQKTHKELINEFKNKKYLTLRGNHDYTLLGILTWKIKTDNGLKVLISHGFQNDKMMTNPLNRAACWIFSIVEKLGFNEDTKTFNKPNSPIDRKTLEYATEQGEKYDIVICGHTHYSKKIYMKNSKHINFVYANSGHCQAGQFSGVLLDTTNGAVELVNN